MDEYQTTMKKILTAALITALIATTSIIIHAEERSIPQKTRDAIDTVVDKTKDAAHDTKEVIKDAARHVRKSTRNAWNKTKAFFSEDKVVYHEGAGATLAGLGREITLLKARTPGDAPLYFRTRLQALNEQHDYLVVRLGQFDGDDLRVRLSGPRYDFDRCITDLEHAIDQAENGADTLTKIARR